MRRPLLPMATYGFVACLLLFATVATLAQGTGPGRPPPGGPDAQGEGPAQEVKYFLRYSGEEAAACEESLLSLTAKDGTDAAMCGELEPEVKPPCAGVCVPDMGDEVTHPLRERFNFTVMEGYPGEAHFSLYFEVPDQVEIRGNIEVGDSLTCFFNEGERTVLAGAWLDIATQPCAFFGGGVGIPVEGDGAEALDLAPSDSSPPPDPGGGKRQSATGKLAFHLYLSKHLNYYIGYEGDHAGWITFGADPPEVKNDTKPPAKPAETPRGSSPGAPLGLIALAALVTLMVLRRLPR